MARFKDLSDKQIRSIGNKIINLALKKVSNQVPIPSRNPFSTGELQRSLSYEWVFEEDVWKLKIDYVDHGKYTLFGTRIHRDIEAESQSWFGRSFQEYSKAKMGIRPQYWLSLRGTRPDFDKLIREELDLTMRTFIDHTISDLSKKLK